MERQGVAGLRVRPLRPTEQPGGLDRNGRLIEQDQLPKDRFWRSNPLEIADGDVRGRGRDASSRGGKRAVMIRALPSPLHRGRASDTIDSQRWHRSSPLLLIASAEYQHQVWSQSSARDALFVNLSAILRQIADYARWQYSICSDRMPLIETIGYTHHAGSEESPCRSMSSP